MTSCRLCHHRVNNLIGHLKRIHTKDYYEAINEIAPTLDRRRKERKEPND